MYFHICGIVVYGQFIITADSTYFFFFVIFLFTLFNPTMIAIETSNYAQYPYFICIALGKRFPNFSILLVINQIRY